MNSNSDKQERLHPAVFDFPVHEIRCGYRSAVYFWRTKRILEREKNRARITHQIFQKKDNVMLCGTDEVIAILKCATGFFTDYDRARALFEQLQKMKQEIQSNSFARDKNISRNLISKQHELSQQLDDLWVDKFDEIEIQSLHDGDELSAWETALFIDGEYALFAQLESLYLGILARRTKLATNARTVVQAAQGKPVLFFADRYDHFATQNGDGYAAHLAGMSGVASDAMASWYGEKGIGTIPHAMIVAYGGDSAKASEKFNKHFPDVNTISLVDFDNDCVKTSLEVAHQLGDKLWGVRLDTANNLIDRSLQEAPEIPEADKFGVAPGLAEKVRKALDAEGFNHVKIIVSGGFNPERIARFEKLGVPVDVYAVGSWMLTGNFDFTADAVRLNGENLAKVGREYRPNPRLVKVD